MGGRILVADEVATNRIVLKVKLSAAFYDVVLAESIEEARSALRRAAPDIVIADARLGGTEGLTLCRAMKADPSTMHIPVVLLANDNDIELRLQALSAGADDILDKPVEETVLLARVRNLLRARESEQELRLRDGTHAALGFSEPTSPIQAPATIALVAGERAQAIHWKHTLTSLLPNDHLRVLSRDDTLGTEFGDAPPEVFVVGASLKEENDGLELMSELRSRAATRHSSIVVANATCDLAIAARAFDLGASDLLRAGTDPRELAQRIQTQIRRKRLGDALRANVRDGLRAAVTDPLTGLYNRRYALPHLSRVRDTALRQNRDFAVMLIDIDFFKSVNDRFGHAAGDAVLVTVASRLKENMRAKDLIARIGGEEFLVVLPDTSREQAKRAAARLCHVVNSSPVRLDEIGEEVPVSVSIGVSVSSANSDGDPSTIARLMAEADSALYGSKSQGRNKFTVSPQAA
ncbi:two-component system, cell cycle response regulator [Poseidonocella pacifica]|uniref:diguanylate cyclase n=1 Tax=Poseidonocella pacifica TaxID=871651 RepID=A0A1I0V3B1_9RHOB|nr:diguanylate cyclase [Poseidonocella pacifica]SFA70771.1 two-component system, cell cycle response regulator [Poseidonocella pacifica]